MTAQADYVNAFYTSPTVIAAIHKAIARLGYPILPPSWNPDAGPAIS